MRDQSDWTRLGISGRMRAPWLELRIHSTILRWVTKRRSGDSVAPPSGSDRCFAIAEWTSDSLEAGLDDHSGKGSYPQAESTKSWSVICSGSLASPLSGANKWNAMAASRICVLRLSSASASLESFAIDRLCGLSGSGSSPRARARAMWSYASIAGTRNLPKSMIDPVRMAWSSM